MQSIQTDMTESALVNAIRGNLIGFFRHLTHRSPPGGGFENNKFTRWYTPLAHPWFNGLVCNLPPIPADGDFIQETIQYFRDRRVNVFTCWLDTSLKRSDWEPFLTRHGFGYSNDTPGMAMDLWSLPESAQMLKGLEICTVDHESDMLAWAHTFTLGYDLPADWESIIFDVWLRIGLDFPVRNYLGYLDGEPVATSTVFYGMGVAGIYDVATLSQARDRGIGTALTMAPLLDARRAGYRIGVLQSSEMGFNVYKKMGFQHLCQIENFYFKS